MAARYRPRLRPDDAAAGAPTRPAIRKRPPTSPARSRTSRRPTRRLLAAARPAPLSSRQAPAPSAANVTTGRPAAWEGVLEGVFDQLLGDRPEPDRRGGRKERLRRRASDGDAVLGAKRARGVGAELAQVGAELDPRRVERTGASSAPRGKLAHPAWVAREEVCSIACGSIIGLPYPSCATARDPARRIASCPRQAPGPSRDGPPPTQCSASKRRGGDIPFLADVLYVTSFAATLTWSSAAGLALGRWRRALSREAAAWSR